MLEDILSWCAIVKDLTRDVLVAQVLKGLPLLHLTLWLLRDRCHTDKSSLHQSVRQWWMSTSSFGKNGKVDVLENVYQRMLYLP